VSGLPDSDVVITEQIVRSLLATSPWPRPSVVELVAFGFDFETWRADELALRLPRRSSVVAALNSEQRWLASATATVGLEVPTVLFEGSPTESFPYPWSVVHFIEGEVGYRVDRRDVASAAAPLGTTLAHLHAVAPHEAPRNPWRGVALSARVDSFDEHARQLPAALRETLRRHFDRAVTATPYQGEARWVHGDIHLGNVIFRDHQLVGLIDFSDLTAGDPATDLGGALFSLPASSHEEFWRAYGTKETALRERAIGWASLFVALHLGIGEEPYVAMATQAATWLSELD